MPSNAKSAYLIFKVDQIKQSTLEEVELKLGENTADVLYLVLETPGGDPFSAVAIMNILQSRFPKISAIVPRYAASAGTLMAIGTDDIYMSERSALGPLDLPIEHPTDGSRISALDVQNTITTMAGLIDSIASNRFNFLRDRKISKKDAAKIALENATDFLKPVIQQIDPYHLQKATRELRIGYWYAIDMLGKRMMKNDSFALRSKTAQTLVHEFPDHEYSIYRDDAEYMLGLTVPDLSKLEIWNVKLKDIYTKIRTKSNHISYGILEEDTVEELKQKENDSPTKPTPKRTKAR